jgi:hypothetical protein
MPHRIGCYYFKFLDGFIRIITYNLLNFNFQVLSLHLYGILHYQRTQLFFFYLGQNTAACNHLKFYLRHLI